LAKETTQATRLCPAFACYGENRLVAPRARRPEWRRDAHDSLYLQRGVLPPPPFMGSATRYQRQHLVRLLAIRRLRVDENLTLDAIRTRLAALSSEELEALATANLPAGPLSDVLGKVAAPPAPVTPARRSISPHLPRWVRIELALGLELHVRSDASVEVTDLARRIRATCSTSIEREPEFPPTLQHETVSSH
jgi:DNA-binding transcriptional MerR regulator